MSDCGLSLLSGHTVMAPQHWQKNCKDFTTEWYHTVEDAASAGQQYLISPWLDSSRWTDKSRLLYFMEI